MPPLTVADAAIAISGDLRQYDKAIAAAEKKGVTAGQAVSKAFSPKNISRALTAAGAIGGTLFTGAIGGAANFEDQLRTINTVAKLTDEGLADVGKSILNLSKETGKSTDDLTAGYYDLVSAGVASADAIDVLRDSAKFATGALGTTAESVDLVTSALNAYGLEANQSTRVTDIFAKAVADGKVTASELGSSIASIAPSAAAAGVSLEEVSAGYALLTAKGVPAAQAATQMRAAISALLTPNAQLNELQKQTGINFAELAREKGLAVALEAVRKATNGNSDAFAKSLGSIEAYQFALASTGDQAGVFADQIVETHNAAGIAQQQYDEKSKSAVEQGKRLAASFRAVALEIGGPFVGSLGAGVIALNELGGGLGGLVNLSRLFGGVFGGLGGKLVSKLLGPLGGLGKRLAAKLGIAFASSVVAGAAEAGGELVGDLSAKAIERRLAGKAASEAIASGLIGATAEGSATGLAAKSAGSRLGMLLGAGIVIAIPLAVAAGLKGVQGELNQAFKDSNLNLELEAAPGEGPFGIYGSIAALKLGFKILSGEVRQGVSDATQTIKDESQFAGGASVQAYGAGAAAAAPAAGSVIGAALRTMGSRAFNLGTSAHYYGGLTAQAFSQGILDARAKPVTAFDTLTQMLKTAMSRPHEIARLMGQLTSKELTKGLKSGDPAVRAQAVFTKQTILDRLTELKAGSSKLSKEAAAFVARGLRSSDPQIKAAAQAIKDNTLAPLKGLPASAGSWGKRTGNAFAQDLRSTAQKAAAAAAYIALAVARNLEIRSPAKEGPMSRGGGPGGWGAKLTTSIAEGMVSQVRDVLRAAATVAGAAVPMLAGAGGPSMVPAGALRTRSVGDFVSSRMQPELLGAVSRGTGRGDVHVPITVQGALPVRTIRDISTEMRRVAELAINPPAMLSPKYRTREATSPA
jgi:TP901 family phage tail tape measure protein